MKNPSDNNHLTIKCHLGDTSEFIDKVEVNLICKERIFECQLKMMTISESSTELKIELALDKTGLSSKGLSSKKEDDPEISETEDSFLAECWKQARREPL